MADPTGPHAGLRQKEVRDRALAARELAATGDWSDIEALIEVSKGDKSTSVRMYAAAAAADLACRTRSVGAGLVGEQKAQIFEWLKGVDPMTNPGLLVLLAASSDQRFLERLGRALRDPRNVVRQGAVAGVRRLALAAVSAKEPHIAEQVAEWLLSGKLLPDVSLELARLVGEAGWTDFDAPLRKAAIAGRPHAAVVDEVFQRLAARDGDITWEGLWASDGQDVFEPRGTAIVEWFLVADGEVRKPGTDAAPLELGDGAGTLDGKPVRLVYAPRGGEPGSHPAIQVEGHTFWKVQGKELVTTLDEIIDGVAELGEAARPVADWLEAVDGTLAARARAIVLYRIGALDEAREALDALCAHKKPRNDLFWWLARVAADQGDTAVAKDSLERFLDKAGKKAAFRKEAEALLGEL